LTTVVETVVPGLDAWYPAPVHSQISMTDYAAFLADAAFLASMDAGGGRTPSVAPYRDPADDARAALELLRETSWVQHRLVIEPGTTWQARRTGGGYVYLSAPANDITAELLGASGPWMPAPPGFCLVGALWHVQGRPILDATGSFLDMLGAPLQAVEDVIRAEWPGAASPPGSVAMHWNDRAWTTWPDVERVLEKTAAC